MNSLTSGGLSRLRPVLLAYICNFIGSKGSSGFKRSGIVDRNTYSAVISISDSKPSFFFIRMLLFSYFYSDFYNSSLISSIAYTITLNASVKRSFRVRAWALARKPNFLFKLLYYWVRSLSCSLKLFLDWRNDLVICAFSLYLSRRFMLVFFI